MIKKLLAITIALAMIFSFAGCKNNEYDNFLSGPDVIVEEEIIIQGDGTLSDESSVSSDNSQDNESVDTPVSSEENSSSEITSKPVKDPNPTEESDIPNIDYSWKSHPEDYKLLAFTFDDGPASLMQKYVQYFAAFEGAGTFFVNGTKIKGNHEYGLMQNAIDYGWDIGNHGDQHLVATIGGAEATYDEIKADITNLTHKLESNLKTRDGAAYKVKFYRPPNIKPTENSFKICGEENLAMIWLSHDALDWDTTKTQQDRYNVIKNGIGKWEDCDIILCHETGGFSEETYKNLEELLPEF